MMRDDMQVGDGVLFYASERGSVRRHRAGDDSCAPAIPEAASGEAGLAHGGHRVRRGASTAVVPLETLKQAKGLEQMMVTQKGSRLSGAAGEQTRVRHHRPHSAAP